MRKIPKINNLIFDLDGVLADTDKARYQILKQVLAEYDIDLEKIATVKDLEGISTKKFLERFLTDLKKYHDDIIKKRHDIYLNNLEKFCIPFPNMKETLEYLANKYTLYVATTNSLDIAIKLLEHLGIKHLFKDILGREKTENENRLKDYSKVLKELKLDKNNCIVIEDSYVGIKAVKDAGLFCIGFNHYNNPEIDKLADIVVNSYLELKEILG